MGSRVLQTQKVKFPNHIRIAYEHPISNAESLRLSEQALYKKASLKSKPHALSLELKETKL
jgi:hypothetical protein